MLNPVHAERADWAEVWELLLKSDQIQQQQNPNSLYSSILESNYVMDEIDLVMINPPQPTLEAKMISNK